MRHHHLRLFLEMRGDNHHRHILLERVERFDEARSHVEIELSCGEQQRVGRLRAALHNLHVQSVFGVGAVGDRLIISAMLGFGEPVGAEPDFVGGVSRNGGETETRCKPNAGEFHHTLLRPRRPALTPATRAPSS
jgi:hypothetical protein